MRRTTDFTHFFFYHKEKNINLCDESVYEYIYKKNIESTPTHHHHRIRFWLIMIGLQVCKKNVQKR